MGYSGNGLDTKNDLNVDRHAARPGPALTMLGRDLHLPGAGDRALRSLEPHADSDGLREREPLSPDIAALLAEVRPRFPLRWAVLVTASAVLGFVAVLGMLWLRAPRPSAVGRTLTPVSSVQAPSPTAAPPSTSSPVAGPTPTGVDQAPRRAVRRARASFSPRTSRRSATPTPPRSSLDLDGPIPPSF